MNVPRRVVFVLTVILVGLCVGLSQAAEPLSDGKQSTDELSEYYLQSMLDKAENDSPAVSLQRDLLPSLRAVIERLDRRPAEQRPKAMPEEPAKESPKELPKDSESDVTKPDDEPIASDDEMLVANRRPTLETFALVVLGLEKAIEGLEIVKLKVIEIAQRQAS